jgi:hypothetical protein
MNIVNKYDQFLKNWNLNLIHSFILSVVYSKNSKKIQENAPDNEPPSPLVVKKLFLQLLI